MALRVDKDGAAFAGSQLQTQLYVNKRTAALDDAIRRALPELAETSVTWLSPLAEDHYREYADRAFLARLNLEEHASALARFWPAQGGPRWDALATVGLPGGASGVLLVEGKSYTDEMLKGSPMGATAAKSQAQILQAIAWTQGRLGIPLDTRTWTGPLYQNANRVAHLEWLRHRGVKAWLVHLLFVDDPHHATTQSQWHDAVAFAEASLGLNGAEVSAGHVYLTAGTRADLLS